MKETEICFLNNSKTLEELLKTELFLSRSFIKKYLTKKQLSLIPKKGQSIRLPIELLNHRLVNPVYTNSDIPILFEDDKFLVFNKPAHVHGHPLSYDETDTVLNFSRSYLNSLFLGLPSSNQERGLLYRLDEVTSGVLIYVKDEKVHEKLRGEFSSCVKEKVYLAIVHGEIAEHGEIRHFFQSAGERGRRRVLSESGEGEFGELRFERLKYIEQKKISVVKVYLKQGVRHQIRAQLAAIHHPILGDELYGGEKSERVFLHALKYSFDFEGRPQTFVATNADLFDDFLDLNTCI
ncbi:RNA pseudouridine synthase [Bacteriovorax sp. BSW11_IV]|uniref:RluA family pseudouridine synthase n=1 Tax=Bacteriovorax sp. BSW11_IV TaxID=1353529 RepID=UPI00038A47C8|nr:RluA family pseudouridine synthase [Bacteriovorax sp. BSW11_IV]EQC49956.1 RNA pseudouridine synthase [Bacteriovorax sp. BSW11_IV]